MVYCIGCTQHLDIALDFFCMNSHITLSLANIRSWWDEHNGNIGCLVFKQGVQNQKYFCLKLLNFENWCSREVSKVPKFDFQSQFSMSKITAIFLNLFSLNDTNLGAHFFYWHFLIWPKSGGEKWSRKIDHFSPSFSCQKLQFWMQILFWG